MARHVNLFVEGSKSGGTQPVEVDECEDGLFRVLYSPGFVEGIAAGDLVRLIDERLGHFEVVERGGNLSVKWAARSEVGGFLSDADSLLEPLGARRDGALSKAAVWTIPVTAGFAAVEATMEQVSKLIPESSWWYGNVYDSDGMPLNWW